MSASLPDQILLLLKQADAVLCQVRTGASGPDDSLSYTLTYPETHESTAEKSAFNANFFFVVVVG